MHTARIHTTAESSIMRVPSLYTLRSLIPVADLPRPIRSCPVSPGSVRLDMDHRRLALRLGLAPDMVESQRRS